MLFEKQETLDLMLSASDFYGDSDIPVFTRISDNIYLINNTGDFLYESKTSDGTTIFEYSSMTYIQSDTVKNEFVAVIIFVMIIIVTIILLVIKGIRKIVKKYKVSPTGKAILTGQFARFVIGTVFVLILTLMIPQTVFVVMCIVTGASAIICAISAIFTAKTLIIQKKMEKIVRLRYTISAVCNMFVVGFVVYFQLFNFWT